MGMKCAGKHAVLLLFLIFVIHSFAQSPKIDSLQKLVDQLGRNEHSFSNDTLRIRALNLLAASLITAGDYAKGDAMAVEALSIAEVAELSSDHVNAFKRGMATSYRNRGNASFYQENYNAALDFYFRVVSCYQILLRDPKQKADEQKQVKKELSWIYRNIANVYLRKDNYANALDYYYRSIKISEEMNDEKSLGVTLGNTGIVYYRMMDYPKALTFYQRALAIVQKLNNEDEIAKNLSNIAIIYTEQKNHSKALEYYIQALRLVEANGNLGYQTSMLDGLASVYTAIGEYDKALECFNKALAIAEELDDKGEISYLNGNIGGLFIRLKKYPEAEKHLLKAESIAREIGELYSLKEWCYNLSEVYRAEKKTELAFKYREQYDEIKDSIFSQENSLNTVRYEMDFEYAKKAAADSVKNAESQKVKDAAILAQKSQIRQERTLRYSLFGGLGLVIIFSLFLFNRFKITNRQKEEINLQKILVEEKNKEVTDSINYAKRIQEALLKEEEHITKHLPDHFVLFKPKDIVSGDFYWSVEKHGYWYLCVADCTGHGVPGAFMSMLGIAYLNEIHAAEGILSPGEILNSLREKIVKELKQKGESGESQDGMDISMIRLNLKNNEMQWAGANNPLWISRVEDGQQVMITVEANKEPIGYTINPGPFKNHPIEILPNDMIYLFSDGYADQFGGPKGKKFKSRHLQEQLLWMCNEPVDKQKELLDRIFEDWRGNIEQLDDVCMIGIRF
jgi:tetratricopeptide (TPR) repeat protein